MHTNNMTVHYFIPYVILNHGILKLMYAKSTLSVSLLQIKTCYQEDNYSALELAKTLILYTVFVVPV